MSETVINLNELRSLFSDDKGLIGKLKRIGLPIAKDNEYGTWFDLSEVQIVVKIKKVRGQGFKEETI